MARRIGSDRPRSANTARTGASASMTISPGATCGSVAASTVAGSARAASPGGGFDRRRVSRGHFKRVFVGSLCRDRSVGDARYWGRRFCDDRRRRRIFRGRGGRGSRVGQGCIGQHGCCRFRCGKAGVRLCGLFRRRGGRFGQQGFSVTVAVARARFSASRGRKLKRRRAGRALHRPYRETGPKVKVAAARSGPVQQFSLDGVKGAA